MKKKSSLKISLITTLVLLGLSVGINSFAFNTKPNKYSHSSQLSDKVIPIQTDRIPPRPKPLLEIGNSLLGVGPIRQGFKVPTGAVWQPSFILFGTYRSAVQSFYNGNENFAEWAHRIDLLGNLYLTPTERIVAGIRFLDQDNEFTNTILSSTEPGQHRYNDEVNAEITTLFFEGDFSELFPFLDKEDKRSLDFYFSVGRQPLSFQRGLLIQDRIDGVGVSKVNLKFKNTVNTRSTFFFGANELNRTNLHSDDDKAKMYGWFNEIDFRTTTIEVDSIYIRSNDSYGDGLYSAVGATQRLGHFNTTFRVLNSTPFGNRTNNNASGTLLYSEISLTPKGTEDLLYANAFAGINKFRSASRDADAGGPLGQTGILFEAAGLSHYPSALSDTPDDAFGGSLGYQRFFDHTRKQVVLELGGRYGRDDISQRAVGSAVRFQSALGQRAVLRLDAFAAYDERPTLIDTDDDLRFGGRAEVLWQF